MKKITTLALVITSLVTFNTFAEERQSGEHSTKGLISASQALKQAQKSSSAAFDSIELVEKEDGTKLYILTPEKQDVIKPVVLDGKSGKDLGKALLKGKYGLQDILSSVNNTHKGRIVAAHKQFIPEIGVVYIVELQNQVNDSSSTLLMIDANTLQVIDSEKMDLKEMDIFGEHYDDFSVFFDYESMHFGHSDIDIDDEPEHRS